jgi:hypothetical protein
MHTMNPPSHGELRAEDIVRISLENVMFHHFVLVSETCESIVSNLYERRMLEEFCVFKLVY